MSRGTTENRGGGEHLTRDAEIDRHLFEDRILFVHLRRISIPRPSSLPHSTPLSAVCTPTEGFSVWTAHPRPSSPPHPTLLSAVCSVHWFERGDVRTKAEDTDEVLTMSVLSCVASSAPAAARSPLCLARRRAETTLLPCAPAPAPEVSNHDAGAFPGSA
eukprot:CAMPEP_0180222448 /NCGR_PEP_ID=MMETSP0987-20121128/20731_1 /TAXON_ID=697907 /ORGANISM="non described non described, Strain CCMP2293" /LENGTH=159 /DNA_ID=CAMNT_0022184567 /DNA_START=41 /DNA_END=517 /DNA_ORIENTATION=+